MPKKIKGKGMKGMTIKGGHKRPTKSGAGLTAKGVAKYRRQNPGSKLQTAVTEKKPTGKRAVLKKQGDKFVAAQYGGQISKLQRSK